ncbi:MAG: glucosamine-6-phosphate deaminase [Clostridia bacterium]|jgi:glucosamine-6-phosphate deaminase|nr:glucosamine-6-phosphate deaminase [Clostridia bacterium]
MNIIIADSYRQLSDTAAEIVANQIKNKPDTVLGLATGSSPLGLYDALAKMCEDGKIDFSRVRTVNLDEYVGLAPDHPQSYRYFMDKNLFDRINIRREMTKVPDGLASDTDAFCKDYDSYIDSLGGIDLQVLGIGPDGHIGFNEPDGHFTAATHVAELDPSTVDANSRFFESRDEVPKTAITMGMRAIMQAKKILLIAPGKAKKEILFKALEGDITPRIPASVLQLHRDVTVIYSDENR